MKTKLLQILYDMKTQPVIAWVTVAATALSVFLIMTVIMMRQVSLVSFKPETHRDRMLYGRCLDLHSLSDSGSSSSAYLSYQSAKKLYGGLDGVEGTTYMDNDYSPVEVNGSSNEKFTADLRHVDEEFWNVFDFDLVAGRYFNADEVAAERNVAIVSESVARRLFGGDDALGQHFELDHNDMVVVGVIRDVSKLASSAYAQVFAPISHEGMWGEYLGTLQAALLLKKGVDGEHIRDQVKVRYAQFDTELKADGVKAVYHDAPFDQETILSGRIYSNASPDPDAGKTQRFLLYAILLIVPAINLSSMLHSRLRRRVSEIGVRRAFGCTRMRIAADIIAENMIVTVAGGVIGFILGVVFAQFYDGLYTNVNGEAVRPALSLLLDWHILLYAFVACFILNIISASVPAWQAARMNPVSAINSK